MASTTVPDRATAVVIGGAVIGLSTAYHLARSGVADVVLVERDALGEGSTCRAAGGVRAQFSDALNVELGLRSLRAFETFSADHGQDIDLHQVGYLFLLERNDDVAAFEAAAEVQRGFGLESHLVTPAEAARLSPLISTEGVIAAAWTPRDGHCTPESVVLGYATAARRAGARLVTGCEVTGIVREGSTITGVETTAGTIATDTVVCCAGAWSRHVGAMVDVDLPVVPLRRQIVTTEPVTGLDPRTPFTIDFSTSLYFHGEGRGLLIGMSDPDETPGFHRGRSDAWLPRLGAAIERRAPALSDVGVSGGWAGLYETTPDDNAIIGEATGVSRFLYATGFSGHGFLMGPAVGEVMRDLVAGDSPVVDVSSLTVDRFAAGTARPERTIV